MHPNRMRRFLWMGVLWVALSVLVSPQPGWSQKKEPLTLKFSWHSAVDKAPIFLGIEKGWFAAEGIDLEFQDGKGTVSNLQLLAAKKLLFGYADLGTAANFVNQGLTIKPVSGYYQISPMSVIAHEAAGIRTLKDLEGKKVGAPPAGSSMALFPAVAKVQGIDLDKIQFVNVTEAALPTVMLNRDVEAILAYFPNQVPMLQSKGLKVNYLRYADLGANTLGLGIVVHNSVLAEKPDTLRRLLRAISKSMAYTLTHLDEGVSAFYKHTPLAGRDLETDRTSLGNYLSLLHTKHSQGKPIGWMARDDWAQTIDLLSKYGGLKNPLPVENYYTNDFISPTPSL